MEFGIILWTSNKSRTIRNASRVTQYCFVPSHATHNHNAILYVETEKKQEEKTQDNKEPATKASAVGNTTTDKTATEWSIVYWEENPFFLLPSKVYNM